MRTRYKLLAAAVLALGLPALPANAEVIIFGTTLTGGGENPPNGSPGMGTMTAWLDNVTDMLTVDETFSGLTAPATGAHIHCCALAGANAPIVLNFIGRGFPTGVTAGTYDHTFNLMTDLAGITVSDFITALESGTAYANIHDANFPGGEIRGQLTRVPEPTTLSLFLFGAGAVALARRKKGPTKG
jgi:hypothetical protein